MTSAGIECKFMYKKKIQTNEMKVIAEGVICQCEKERERESEGV